jgi:hypothetical protein
VKKLLPFIAMGVLAGLPAAAQTQQPIRVNSGGPSYTDSNGNVWQADTGYNGARQAPTPRPRRAPAIRLSTAAIATLPTAHR